MKFPILVKLMLATILLMSAQLHAQPLRLKSVVSYFGAPDTTFAIKRLAVNDSLELKYKAGNNYEGRIEDYTLDMPGYDTADRWFSPTGVPELGAQYIYYYNANKKVDTVNEYKISIWEGTHLRRQFYYTYDADGNEISQTISNWESWGKTWDTIGRRLKRYSGGMLSEIETQVYIQGRWQQLWLKKYTYQGGNLIARREEAWDDNEGNWEANGIRYAYAYDAANNIIADSFQIRDIANNKWFAKNVIVRTWNASNQPLTTDGWDYTMGTWGNSSGAIFLYNSAGLRICDSIWVWHKASNKNQPRFRSIYTYSTGNMPDTVTDQTYSITSGIFLDNQRKCYAYNAQGLKTWEISEKWDFSFRDWYYHDTSYQYYYTPFDTTTGIMPLLSQATNIHLYPNPANDFITLKLDNKQSSIVAIYNTTGALLRQWEEKSGSTIRTIPLHGFENGNYILTVRGADGSKVSKQFMVER